MSSIILQTEGCNLEKRVLIAFGLVLLFITIYSALAQEVNETIIIVPLEELNQTQEEIVEEPVVTEELPENITEEIEEIVEELPEEIEEVNVTEEPEEVEVIPEEENVTEEIIIAPPKPGILTRITNFGRVVVAKFINLGKGAYYKVRYAGGWIITRDYPAVARNTASFVLGLRLWIKILLIIIALIIILIIWAYYFRDTRGNNLRRARRHHKKGLAALA